MVSFYLVATSCILALTRVRISNQSTNPPSCDRYEVGRFFGAVERLKRAAEEQNQQEAQKAFAAMSVAYDRYLKVGDGWNWCCAGADPRAHASVINSIVALFLEEGGESWHTSPSTRGRMLASRRNNTLSYYFEEEKIASCGAPGVFAPYIIYIYIYMCFQE